MSLEDTAARQDAIESVSDAPPSEVRAQLRDSERNFRLLVQSVTDYAIYMLDTDGTVASWNAGAERIKGYTAGEIIGHKFAEFFTLPDREAGVPDMALKIAGETGRF